MKYHNGTPVALGDVVSVAVPGGTAEARVVMLGDTYEHLDIDRQFLSWVETERTLNKSSVVIEWLGANRFAHDDPKFAPVGNYMFCPIDEYTTLWKQSSTASQSDPE
jgi:hypothetical protein